MIKFLAFLIVILFYIPQAYAADSTPSADIKAKLEALKKEIASKAAKLKQDVNNKLKDKAYVGKVKAKSTSSITLATKTGPKIVSLNQDTIFESNIKSKVKFTQKSIREEDYIAGLGDIDETGVLIAKKVILLETPSKEKTYLWGQVLSISEKLVTIKDKELKNQAVTNPTDVKFSVNDFVILTGNLGKNDIFGTDFAYIIPQGGILKVKKISSPSATLKPMSTPSAKPR